MLNFRTVENIEHTAYRADYPHLNLNIGHLTTGSAYDLWHCRRRRVASATLGQQCHRIRNMLLQLLLLQLLLKQQLLLLLILMLMLMLLTTAGTTLMIIDGGASVIKTTQIMLRQSDNNDGNIVGSMIAASDSSSSSGSRRHWSSDGCSRVLWTGRLIDLITHHITIELEHIQLAHGARAMLD